MCSAIWRLRNLPPRVDGRLFYADLQTGEIKEFLLPQFANGSLPNGLTVHGFGEDGDGELYAMVTNTPSNGTGGIIYKLVRVPEPASALLALAAGIAGSMMAPAAKLTWFESRVARHFRACHPILLCHS